MKTKAVTFESDHFSVHIAKNCYTLRLRDDDMGAGLIVVSTSSRREFFGTLDEMQDELRAFAWEIDRGYGVVKDIDPDSFQPGNDSGKTTSSEEANSDG